MTRKNFEIALEKGKIGERIVRELLEAKGWIVYCPFSPGAHAFDMLATLNKERAIALDVKAKARMNNYPATGINTTHYEQYLRFSLKHSMPFYLIFVDEHTNEIYGNTLSQLDKPTIINGIQYPLTKTTRFNKSIRLWPLANMTHYGHIPSEDLDALKQLSQRSYDFKPVQDS